MAKEINEKTFELNITNELLNLSKSFIWYLDLFPWFHFNSMRNRNIISQFMKQSTLFAEGLTQKEERNILIKKTPTPVEKKALTNVKSEGLKNVMENFFK